MNERGFDKTFVQRLAASDFIKQGETPPRPRDKRMAKASQVNKGKKGMKIYGAPKNLQSVITPEGKQVYWRDATAEQRQQAKTGVFNGSYCQTIKF